MNSTQLCLQSQISPAVVVTKSKNEKLSSKISRWTPVETVLYIRFLKHNLNQLINHTNKKFLKFQKMSQQIQSKTPNQCRSHHQKMLNKFKTIQNIIDGIVPQTPDQVVELEAPTKKISQCQSQQTQEQNETDEISINNNLPDQQIFMQKEDLAFSWRTDDNIFDVLFNYGMSEQ